MGKKLFENFAWIFFKPDNNTANLKWSICKEITYTQNIAISYTQNIAISYKDIPNILVVLYSKIKNMKFDCYFKLYNTILSYLVLSSLVLKIRMLL